METRLPPALIVLVLSAAMYGVSVSPLALPFETAANAWLARALIVAGIAAAVLGIVQFSRHGTTVDPTRPERASTLVTSGIFAVTRNPIYLGMQLVLLGIGAALGSGGALLVALAFAPLITALQIRAEERAMRELFGDAWDAYAARVRRWL